MHEFRFQGITVIVCAIEGDIDDEDADGEVMPPHVIRIPLISYYCTLILIYNLSDCIVNCQICQMAQDLCVAIKCRILAGCFDGFVVQTNITNGLVAASLYFAEAKNKDLLISAMLCSLKL